MLWYSLIFISLWATAVKARGLQTDGVVFTSESGSVPGFQVYFFHHTESFRRPTFLCYGVRLKQNYYATTASCFNSFKEQSGEFKIKDVFVSPARQPYPIGSKVKVIKVVRHENFTKLTGNSPPKSWKNDIAIVRAENFVADTTADADLPVASPQVPQKCSFVIFEKEPTEDYVRYKRKTAYIQHIGECASANNVDKEQLSSSFCVQIHDGTESELLAGAPITCDGKVSGVFSWSPPKDVNGINSLVISSFADQLKWIKDRLSDKLEISSSTSPSPSPSPSTLTLALTSTSPSPSPSSSASASPTTTTSSEGISSSTSQKSTTPDTGDSSPVQSVPWSLPLLLLISLFAVVLN